MGGRGRGGVVKRSPIKPGQAPKRKTPLKPGKPLRAKKAPTRHQAPASGRLCARAPVRQVSKKKRAQKRSRAALVRWLVAEGVRCEVCPELARVGIVIPGGCSGFSEIHERRKQSGAGSMEVAGNLLPICRMANGWIEDQAGTVRERFAPWLVLREKDPEWHEYGRRADPVPVEVKWCGRCGAAYVTVPPSGVLACGHDHAP